MTSDSDGIENPANGSPGFSSTGDYTRTVSESLGKDMPVGDPVTAIDPNDDTLTYELDSNTEPATNIDGTVNTDDTATPADHDVHFFSIDAATGQLRVKETLDYDSNMDGYKFYVRAIDPSGETAEVEVTVKTEDANDAPVDNGESDPARD